MPDFQKFVDGETGTEYTVKDAEARKNIETLQGDINAQNDNITTLQTKFSSFENAKSRIISSALGQALGMTASTVLATVADKIVAVIDRSSTIQTATTSTSDQNASAFRVNGTNIEIVPAKGLWNNWDWTKSCIRITAAALGITAAKIVKGNTIVGIAGTDAGYAAGVTAGKNAVAYKIDVNRTTGASAALTIAVPSGHTKCVMACFAGDVTHDVTISFSKTAAADLGTGSLLTNNRTKYSAPVFNVSSSGENITVTATGGGSNDISLVVISVFI